MSKAAKKTSTTSAALAPSAKSSPQTIGEPKSKKTEPGSKQSRVVTMLQAPEGLLGEMLALARRAAEQEGIAKDGFRVVVNTHPNGGQGVYHLHMHVLGGRQMGWPPG